MTDDDKARIVALLNQHYHDTTLAVDVVEIAVATGFASWTALQAEADAYALRDPTAPVTLAGFPVRIDGTLCAPGELWMEGREGDAVRVWPPPSTNAVREDGE